VRIAHVVIVEGDRTLQRYRPLKDLRFRLSLGQPLPVSTGTYSALMPEWETMAVLETKRAFALLLKPTFVDAPIWAPPPNRVALTGTREIDQGSKPIPKLYTPRLARFMQNIGVVAWRRLSGQSGQCVRNYQTIRTVWRGCFQIEQMKGLEKLWALISILRIKIWADGERGST